MWIALGAGIRLGSLSHLDKILTTASRGSRLLSIFHKMLKVTFNTTLQGKSGACKRLLDWHMEVQETQEYG